MHCMQRAALKVVYKGQFPLGEIGLQFSFLQKFFKVSRVASFLSALLYTWVLNL